MADIKQAFKYAAQNPNSDFAANLVKLAASGTLDKEAEQNGIDLSAFKPKAPAPTNQVAKVGPQPNSAVQNVVKNTVQGTMQDYSKAIPDFIDQAGKNDNSVSQRSQLDPAGIGKIVENAAGATASGFSTIFAPLSNAIKSISSQAGNSPTLQAVAQNPSVSKLLDFFNNQEGKLAAWATAHPEAARNLTNAITIASTAVGEKPVNEAASAAKDAVTSAAQTGVDAVKSGVNSVVDAGANVVNKTGEAIKTGVDAVGKVVNSDTAKGMGQTISDLADRVPNAARSAADFTKEQAARADRLAKATPEVSQAIRANLPDTFINTVGQADKPTLQAYKDVVDLAEAPGKAQTIGMKTQPTKVGGDLAAQQYEVINAEKKNIGSQIGDEVANITKSKKPVDLTSGIKDVEDILTKNDIKVSTNDEGKQILDFSESKFSKPEQAKIQELYDESTSLGEVSTPKKVYNKNQLFGKLQREAAFDKIGNIIVDTPDGGKANLFQVFRDAYMKPLEQISPKILELNGKYKQFSQLTGDIEDSIFKTSNLNLAKNVDLGEIGKVNLRRIFGEAQSSPAYEAVADAMDAKARELGYTGATPKTIAQFAQEIRTIYPEIIPKTGFTGSIKGVLGGVDSLASKVTEIGLPGTKEQQAALRKIIEAAIKAAK